MECLLPNAALCWLTHHLVVPPELYPTSLARFNNHEKHRLMCWHFSFKTLFGKRLRVVSKKKKKRTAGGLNNNNNNKIRVISEKYSHSLHLSHGFSYHCMLVYSRHLPCNFSASYYYFVAFAFSPVFTVVWGNLRLGLESQQVWLFNVFSFFFLLLWVNVPRSCDSNWKIRLNKFHRELKIIIALQHRFIKIDSQISVAVKTTKFGCFAKTTFKIFSNDSTSCLYVYLFYNSVRRMVLYTFFFLI